MELIPFGLYLAALILALPAAPIAISCLVLNHAIITRNPFRIFYDLIRAVVWFVPLVAIVLLALLVCAVFPSARHYASMFIALLNAAIATIILVSVNRAEAGQANYLSLAILLLPAIVSFLLATSLACRLF